MHREHNVTVTEVLIAMAIMGLLLWGVAMVVARVGGEQVESTPVGRGLRLATPLRVAAADEAGLTRQWAGLESAAAEPHNDPLTAAQGARTYWATLLQVQWRVAPADWRTS